MKNFLKYSCVFLFTLFISCKEEPKKPKVTYDTASKPKTEQNAKTTNIVLADLPIQMDGTSVLLFPVGEFSVAEGLKSKYNSNESFKISNYSEYEITGFLSNIKFQEIGSDSLKVLTEKPVLIERVTYLKTIADKTKKQFLVYILEDMDSNKDGKLDENDIKNLYISNIDGSNFKKLSIDFQELIDWNVIDSQNRLYFRTIEDANKNGEFDKNDILHYHFIDLLDKDLKVVEYSVIN